MVSAVTGVLLQCDVPTKEFILSLNEARGQNDKFVIEDLDNVTLFVKAGVVDWLSKQLQEFQERITYQPPRYADQQQAH